MRSKRGAAACIGEASAVNDGCLHFIGRLRCLSDNRTTTVIMAEGLLLAARDVRLIFHHLVRNSPPGHSTLRAG